MADSGREMQLKVSDHRRCPVEQALEFEAEQLTSQTGVGRHLIGKTEVILDWQTNFICMLKWIYLSHLIQIV